MRRLYLTHVLLMALLGLAACASTTFTSTWKAPDAQALDPQGRKVAAVFITTDESSRREAEDVLVQKLDEHGAQGVPAYSLISTTDVRDLERVKERLAGEGIDGVVVLRVIDEKEKTTVRPGAPYVGFDPYYHRFSGFWGYGWGAPYAPTEVTTTTLLRVESLVYSLNRDELLWAGTSRTVNPGKVSQFVEEVADAAAKEMTREGLLPREQAASANLTGPGSPPVPHALEVTRADDGGARRRSGAYARPPECEFTT